MQAKLLTVRNRGQKVPYFIEQKLILKEQIQQLADNHLQGSEVFVTGIKIGSDNSIHVFIDGDKGVTIKDCVDLSRTIESNLDRNRQDFSLDVSSHGATTPLVIPRQYPKHVGRNFEIRLNNGEKAEGALMSCSNESITLENTTRESKPLGKGKMTVTHQRVIFFNDIKESKIKLKY